MKLHLSQHNVDRKLLVGKLLFCLGAIMPNNADTIKDSNVERCCMVQLAIVILTRDRHYETGFMLLFKVFLVGIYGFP